jgi:prepilin-type N-terminal cleavage/methylation domain-containing protein
MKTQGGFTLIELLVVIAILAVLFGVTALALNGVGSNAAQVTKDAELDVVQTAVDVHMASTSATSITASGATAVHVGPGSPAGFGDYLRRDSKYFYCWTAAGVVTQKDAAVACP